MKFAALTASALVVASWQVGKPGIQGKPSSTGRWTVTSSKSEMTDLETVIGRLAADSALPGGLGSVTPVLILRCQDKKFDVFIDTKMVLEGGPPNRVRWDDREPIDDYSWSRSSDLQALFTSSATTFVEVAMKAKRLRFEFSAFQSGSRVASFSLAGLSAILPRFQKACDLRSHLR